MTSAARGRFAALAGAGALIASCAAPRSAAPVQLRAWGSMREVLREGRTEGRVDLDAAARPGAIGVGALAGLAGEVTVLDGRVLVAVPAARERIAVRDARPGERAALLFLAGVERWAQSPLPDCASYDELEDAIGRALVARGHDPAVPVPVRVRGIAEEYALHVVAGACPVARPDGPPPRRHRAARAPIELVGFYADGAAGQLTHHDRRSHLHVVAPGAMGHLDAVRLTQAVLLVPADLP
jgi:hypothetical protein